MGQPRVQIAPTLALLPTVAVGVGQLLIAQHRVPDQTNFFRPNSRIIAPFQHAGEGLD